MRAPASAFLVLTFVLGGLVGCMPEPPDPLDWRLSATTPNEFNRWCQEHEPRMGPLVHEDFMGAIRQLATKAGRHGQAFDMRETNNPLCQRVHQLTLRAVLIDGLVARRDVLAAQLTLAQENLRRRVEMSAEADPARAAAYRRGFSAAEQNIAELQQLIARTEARIHLYESGGDPDLLGTMENPVTSSS